MFLKAIDFGAHRGQIRNERCQGRAADKRVYILRAGRGLRARRPADQAGERVRGVIAEQEDAASTRCAAGAARDVHRGTAADNLSALQQDRTGTTAASTTGTASAARATRRSGTAVDRGLWLAESAVGVLHLCYRAGREGVKVSAGTFASTRYSSHLSDDLLTSVESVALRTLSSGRL